MKELLDDNHNNTGTRFIFGDEYSESGSFDERNIAAGVEFIACHSAVDTTRTNTADAY